MRRTKQWMALLVASCMLLTACGQKQEENAETPVQTEEAVEESAEESTEESTEEEAPEEETSAEAEGDYGTVTIQDGERTVTFTKMPEKVLCANLYSAENLAMLGLADRIVAKNVATNPAEVPLEELQDELGDVPELEKSHENAVASGADLVIGQVSAFKDTAWGTYEQLESKGINCLTISGTIVEDETVENVYQDIENLGKIFKVEDKAAELIELAGGINATRGMADSRWFNTSVETIVQTNPDVIIINDYGKQTVEEKMEFLNSNPALAEVPAVKNQNILVIPLVSVMQDVRAASACRTIAEFLYPECFE
ncbi:MAG: ABC transporter substrate-binding protein [Clostridiales bacterium]|nr:ABC transporter substrate-binding protein [Clostridiales bacterium]